MGKLPAAAGFPHRMSQSGHRMVTALVHAGRFAWVKGTGIPKLIESCKESKRFVEETAIPAVTEASDFIKARARMPPNPVPGMGPLSDAAPLHLSLGHPRPAEQLGDS